MDKRAFGHDRSVKSNYNEIFRRRTLNGWWRRPTDKPFGSNNERLDVRAPSNVTRLQSCAAGAFF